MFSILSVGLAMALFAAQGDGPVVTAVPAETTVDSVVILLPPDAGGDGVASWSATDGEFCISRLCEWVSPTLTIPAHTEPAYWRSDSAGTFTITWTQGLASASTQIVVSDPNSGD